MVLLAVAGLPVGEAGWQAPPNQTLKRSSLLCVTQTPQEMTAGMHLPQAGPAASGESLTAAAVLSEELGFADVWVSDHLVVPTGVPYPPSAYVLEPLTVMTWVAAATTRVHIGTTVLVMPMRNPIVVAKSIATIDVLSAGRVILGTAAGWLRAEFDALGVRGAWSAHQRGD